MNRIASFAETLGNKDALKLTSISSSSILIFLIITTKCLEFLTCEPVLPLEVKLGNISPYTAGISEDIRQICRKYDMQVIFRSGRSLRSVLSKMKHPLLV